MDDAIHAGGDVTYGYVSVAYNLKWDGSGQGYIWIELIAIHNKASSGVLNVSIKYEKITRDYN